MRLEKGERVGGCCGGGTRPNVGWKEDPKAAETSHYLLAAHAAV